MKKNLVESQEKQSNFSLINLGVVYSYFIFRLYVVAFDQKANMVPLTVLPVNGPFGVSNNSP